MTLIRGRGRLSRKRSFVALFNFSLPSVSSDKLSDQPTGFSKTKLSIVVILVTTLTVFKYTEKDLQQIFKTVLEAQAPITSKKPWDKSLKARFPDVYHKKSHIEYYNFCQQYED